MINMGSNLVFVIEDNPVQQKMLQTHFEDVSGRYTLRMFSNSENMMGHLREEPLAIVLDHFFGENKKKTGLHLLREIRKINPSVPVVYYTAVNNVAIRSEVISLGACQYILKDADSLPKLRTALDMLYTKA